METIGRLTVYLAVSAALLGALPYVARFFPLRDNVSGAADLALARAALDYRFPYLLYPIALPALLSLLSLLYHDSPLKLQFGFPGAVR